MRGCACRGTAGFVHVSCLAEQAKILCAEAVENNLDWKVKNERCHLWDTCSLCEQKYHGVVRCALGWACWKTYVGRPEADPSRCMAMTHLGNGLRGAKLYEDALSVQEVELSMKQRVGASECSLLATQNNLAITYEAVGRPEHSLPLKRDVYSGWLKLYGEEHEITLTAANNYAWGLTLNGSDHTSNFVPFFILAEAFRTKRRLSSSIDDFVICNLQVHMPFFVILGALDPSTSKTPFDTCLSFSS